MPRPLPTKEIHQLLRLHSPYWIRQLENHPEDLDWLQSGTPIQQGRTPARLKAEWHANHWPELGATETFERLHEVKRREMLRITLRDLSNLGSLEEIVFELSLLADFCVQHGLDAILREMTQRHGTPQAAFCVFGMGKLGGHELNYSSDIDLIFAYSDEGRVGRFTHHEYYMRVCEQFIRGFRGTGGLGPLFRVDLRLRPEGDSGPITRSLESYENYYAAFGEVWERMALQKTRWIAGDAELGYEFIQRLQPFCFPRHLPPSALDEIFEIKTRIENEIVKDGGLERHVKLGRGGIREIEFSIQALQLIHGAHHAFSQDPGTMKSLKALHHLELISSPDCAALARAYLFLRRLEHRLQMKENQQTHTVPEDLEIQTELARGLGYASHAAFKKEWTSHLDFVRQFFHNIVRPQKVENATTTVRSDRALPAWDKDSPERDAFLIEAGFENPKGAARIMNALSRGPEYAHVSVRTRRMFDQIAPHLFRTIRKLGRPDFALGQFERFIEAYGTRASLYELLASNPKMVELLMNLFDHSRFLSDVICRNPALLEAIAFEGMLTFSRDRKGMEEAYDREISQDLPTRLRMLKRMELLRIELRDILHIAPSLEETFQEISILADTCLDRALREIKPSKKKGASPPMAVIALGKYGGCELTYGSDLDVLFVGGTTDLATRIVQTMSQEQELGIVFKIDARLRPDGHDGALTLPLEAYAKYFLTRAQCWEHLALTRARFAAGDRTLGESFIRLIEDTIYAKPLTADHKREILEMRERIEHERGHSADPIRDFKTGAGGLVDVEFLAQIQQLQYGATHPAIRHLSTLGVLRLMPELAQWNTEDVQSLIQDYLWLRKLECQLRDFHHSPVADMPADRTQWHPTAVHMGYDSVEKLEQALSENRSRIRSLFLKLSGTLNSPSKGIQSNPSKKAVKKVKSTRSRSRD